MWLSSSSVGRKFIMALTGACLVLFVTFHCLMNAVAICWPTAYNSVCLFLGANWYALAASAGLALLILIHIIYAVMLTLQNRTARGSQRYAISRRPKTVEWSSQNMFVLGIVILAFLVVHLIQFWAKMQLAEIAGTEGVIPAAAGTLFLQEAFGQWWTLVVYAIGFIALWFHMNHGFWSMFQSIGWDNTIWIPRLKKIGCWWVSIVCLLFLAEGVVFTVRAQEGYYKNDSDLREQYKLMLVETVEKELGADAGQMPLMMEMMPFDQLSQTVRTQNAQLEGTLQQLSSPEVQQQMKADPNAKEQVEMIKKQAQLFKDLTEFFNYIEGPQAQQPQQPQMMPY